MPATTKFLLFRFCAYGMFCCFAEIFHTAIDLGGARYGSEYPQFFSRLRHIVRLRRFEGFTTLWAFLAYGASMTFAFEPIHNVIWRWPIFLRGAIYTPCFYLGEFLFIVSFMGVFKRHPWPYKASWLAPKGLINFGYAPLWFLLMLILEQLHNLLLQHLRF